MASPQLENGHIKIANELFEALMLVSILQYERAVFDCVMRRTYGWNKKSDWVSLGQISDTTGISRTNVPRTIRALIDKNMIIKSGKKLSIQKDWEKWKVEWRKLPHKVTGVISPDNRVLSHQITEVLSHKILTKDSKDTLQNKGEQSSQKDMGWNNKSDDYEEGVVDLDTGVLSRPLEEKKTEEKAAREKAKKEVLLIEEVRGLKYTPQALNADAKTYQQLQEDGWSKKAIMGEYLELIKSKFWKEEKKKGRFPGMNTVQFSLRNKKPK